MTIWHEDQLLIDGELVPAANGATYETINPATEEVLGSAADASLDDTERAIAAARRAFDTTDWSTDVALRVRCLRQLHKALLDNVEGLRDIIVQEVGAPVSSTLVPIASSQKPICLSPHIIDIRTADPSTIAASTTCPVPEVRPAARSADRDRELVCRSHRGVRLHRGPR